MGTKDKRFDAYIAKADDFAQPILEQLREAVHRACPDVEETMKWSSPTFMHHGILCGMAAFKQHCMFHFWKEPLLRSQETDAVLGQLNRLQDVSELPPKRTITKLIKTAMALNEDGVVAPRAKPTKKAVAVPDDLMAALKKNRRALTAFEKFSPSHKREYVEWIAEAKRDETRNRRIVTAIAWMSDGKPRNWKYM